MAGDQAASARGTAARRGTGALLLVLALVAWGFVLRLPPTGADAYPLLEQAARCLRDPGRLLRETYLEGAPIGAHFYRPLFVGLFSLQWLAFGELAWPYHALRLGAYLALALGVAALVRRRPGAGEGAALAAAVLVLLHPLQADMLPSLARSADVLADLLLCATLLTCARAQPSRGALGLGVLAALAAPAVKESGLIAPLIALAVLEPWRASAAGARRAASLALLVGLVLQVGLRWVSLGSLGGYGALSGRPGGALANLRVLGAALVDRDPGLGAALLGGLVVAALALSRTAARAPDSAARDWILTRRGALLWLVFVLFGALTSPRLVERHAVALLAPAALLAAPALGDLAARAGRSRLRAAGRVLLALALLGVLAPRSPLWRRYSQWDVIGQMTERVIAAADGAVSELAATGRPGVASAGVVRVRAEHAGERVRVRVEPFPMRAGPPQGPRAEALHQPMILLPYSLAAALRLRGRARELEILPGALLEVVPAHLATPDAAAPPRQGVRSPDSRP